MKSRLYFNPMHLPSLRGEYILWCDGMGTGQMLKRSLSRSAHFIFKIHQAFDIALRDTDGRCYPVMDGMYITTPTRKSMIRIIEVAFCELAREFIHTKGTRHMFMIKAGLSYGATIHGNEIATEAFYGVHQDGTTRSLEEHEKSSIDYIRSRLLLSSAMEYAFQAERNAPPFGIFVHESAQNVPQLVDEEDKGFISNLYQWWRENEEAKQIAILLAKQVFFYLNKAKTYPLNK